MPVLTKYALWENKLILYNIRLYVFFLLHRAHNNYVL